MSDEGWVGHSDPTSTVPERGPSYRLHSHSPRKSWGASLSPPLYPLQESCPEQDNKSARGVDGYGYGTMEQPERGSFQGLSQPGWWQELSQALSFLQLQGLQGKATNPFPTQADTGGGAEAGGEGAPLT